MLSSREIAICINRKLDSMSTDEKVKYFNELGVEVVKAPPAPHKRKTIKKSRTSTPRKKAAARPSLAVASMVARNAK